MADVTIVVCGPFPPPIHGAAVITEAFARRLENQATVVRADVGADQATTGLAYHFARLTRVGSAVAAIVRNRRTAPRYLYVSVAGGWGVVYNLLVTSMARLFHYQVILHHHSFSYLDRPRVLMRMLVTLAGGKATHLVLCPQMGIRLCDLYRATRLHHLSNAWWLKPDLELEPATHGSSLRLGHLSNLCHTKGLSDVLAVYKRLLAHSCDVTLTLAGPSVCRAADDLLEGIAQTDSIDWLGRVDGARKSQFFRDIDVFLFPTRYRNEAEPLVIYEALAGGSPVLATMRGCIGDQLDQVAGRSFAEGSFVDEAVDVIEAFLAQPESLQRAQQRAVNLAHERYVQGQQQLADVLADIAR